jgi:hypothetical protein
MRQSTLLIRERFAVANPPLILTPISEIAGFDGIDGLLVQLIKAGLETLGRLDGRS